MRRAHLVQLGFVIVLLFGGFTAWSQVRHWSTFGHWMPLQLHSDLLVRNAEIGIPGITKTYEATITNGAPLPVVMERCEYISDTNSNETAIAYRIERKPRGSGTWQTALDINNGDYCQPAPTWGGSTHLVSKWLWPGQTLSVGEEATAARQPFEVGDFARFAVYLRPGGESVLSPIFLIDETALDQVPYRTKH